MKSALNELSTLPEARGSFVDAFGGRYYRITDSDRLPTFLMNVVSSSDLWLFLASNGGLTAGRISAEHALFPYQTVDRIYDSVGAIGPFTLLSASRDGKVGALWEPLAEHAPLLHPVRRNLYKSVEGDRAWFEEIHDDLGLAFRYGWSTAEEFGFVRRCTVENTGRTPTSLRLIDGLRHLLPPGIPGRLQNDSSCLTDAYKTSELLSGGTMAVYSLAAGIVDRAIPMESLRASAVWSHGLPDAEILLSEAQIPVFLAGGKPETETRKRGIRGVYAISAEFELAPGESRSWMFVADTDITQAELVRRRKLLRSGNLPERVAEAVDASTQRLRTLVASADGLQAGGDETVTAHHFANVLFNIMRGGVFASGTLIPSRDFSNFVGVRNKEVARRHADFLSGLPAEVPRETFVSTLAATGDQDLERLGLEYLPLTFSRRHGDPSRPWNKFNIRVRDEAGGRALNHEGNWRDIFQNWEALCLSFPPFFESMVAKFVNASTADGYNPYRISREGLDWEVPDPEDPWSSIGYWGDHQTIYLLKLLDWSGRFHPGLVDRWLRQDLFAYADVPYRIADYDAMRHDPHVTIEFDEARHRAIMDDIGNLGSDARLLRNLDGSIQHVNLTEKLLLLVLTKLTNFVPGGGIWMNTQRPEWNDANNALVGYGVSMVTLCYLRRFLEHFRQRLLPALGSAPFLVSSSLERLCGEVSDAFRRSHGLLEKAEIDDADRRSLLDALAVAGSSYRASVYARGPRSRSSMPVERLADLLSLALEFVDHTVRSNRRPDGLYHSYNLLEFAEEPSALRLHRLAPMLEGQVAVLSSGCLSPSEVVALMESLKKSALYRKDQHSYLLYPDRQLPGFLERNLIPREAVAYCSLLKGLEQAGDTRLLVRDLDGEYRFHPDLVNGDALKACLDQLGSDPRWAREVGACAPQVRAVYERVFRHRAFTGRSGAMFGYEGLGCIYWHMVAKLLLAVQENFLAADKAGDPAALRLAAIYHDIRAGLGSNKSPSQYGAFPTDPYSHTPGHSGAQQPGMTGQVKEEILSRLGELGVLVEEGRIAFRPKLLRAGEFSSAPAVFAYRDNDGGERTLALPGGALAFTYCGTPVVYRLSEGPYRLRIGLREGTFLESNTGFLERELAGELCSRSGLVVSLEVFLGGTFRLDA